MRWIKHSKIEVKEQSGVKKWKYIIDGDETYETPAEVDAHATN